MFQFEERGDVLIMPVGCWGRGMGNKAIRVLAYFCIWSLAGVLMIAGCQAAPNPIVKAEMARPLPSARDMKSVQVIIKFRSGVIDATRPDVAAGLSRDAGAPLVYVRSMSGGAHVFLLGPGADPSHLTAIIKRLSDRPDILYIEQDRILQHQKEP